MIVNNFRIGAIMLNKVKRAYDFINYKKQYLF